MKKLLSLFLILASTQLFSCVGIRANKVPEIRNESINTSYQFKTKIYSEWSFKSYFDKKVSKNFKENISRNAKDQFNKTIKASNCCIIVKSKEEADIVIEAIAHDDNRINNTSLALTGATLYLIPSIQDVIAHISAKVHKDKKLYKYDYQDSMKMVQWLPLIIVSPFMNPFTASSSMDKNLYKALVFDMKKDGIIK